LEVPQGEAATKAANSNKAVIEQKSAVGSSGRAALLGEILSHLPPSPAGNAAVAEEASVFFTV